MHKIITEHPHSQSQICEVSTLSSRGLLGYEAM